MADNEATPQSGGQGIITNSFTKGMIKDSNDSYVGEGMWTHARNAVNNSHDGQVGVIGNEPANLYCTTIPYTVIGCIHLFEDQWAIFSTDDVNSEIGVFDESECSYTTRVNDPCLNFKRSHLITGAYRYRYDCESVIYWEDGLNPSRTMDLDTIPWIQNCTTVDGCIICEDTTRLDCEKIRLAPLIKQPCLEIRKGKSGGTLENGSYQVCIAYLINGQKFGDYLGLTEVQPVWSWENVSGSIEVVVKDIDTSFTHFRVVVVSNVNANTTAKIIGDYSTATGTIYIDRIDSEAGTVPIDEIVLRTEPIEKADSMWALNGYLLRSGVYSKYKFNYQPQANKIVTKWVATEYPADYYIKGGNNTGYMRDEVYAFFIRWVYNTGDKSESYHIPGRAALPSDLLLNFTSDAYETITIGQQMAEWQVNNTASITSLATYSLPDGGRVIATGDMAYWESTEKYPDRTPEIWAELCGKNIRHHKMPDETVGTVLNTYTQNGNYINLLGVKFENITHPLDENGLPIQNILGYEILRGSREGNKTIVAKGLFNNMREYDIPGINPASTKGLFQNYPYNDLSPDPYLTPTPQYGNSGQVNVTTAKMSAYRKDIFSFHSPDTTFKNPFLAINEIKIYGNAYGESKGTFEVPFNHPRFKVFSDLSGTIASVVGLAAQLTQYKNIIAGIAGGGAPSAQGYKFTGTEKIPAEFNFGPLGPFPKFPNFVSGGGFVGTTLAIAQNIAMGALWLVEVGLWVTELLVLIDLAQYMAQVEEQKVLDIFKALLPKIQCAVQYNSHGFYNQFRTSVSGERRREVINYTYVKPSIQVYDEFHQINNTFRSQYIALGLGAIIADPSVTDTSRFLESDVNTGVGTKNYAIRTISSHYGSIKIPMPSQYGQLEYIKQYLITSCYKPTAPTLPTITYNSDVYFGGDIYINRFTEKNSFFFFETWLRGEPDEYEFDYTLYNNIPYPRYWINTTPILYSVFGGLPHKFRALDHRQSGIFAVTQGYFYLFNSGVRDFFCEAEVNTAFRDWEDPIEKRHYDAYRYSDLNTMFRSDVLQYGNFYKYDYSLSISKLFNSHISWGNMLPFDYDPKVASTCFKYDVYRIIYSLPQDDLSKMDAWRIFLTNNYKDFASKVTAIRQVERTGALFLLNSSSPLRFVGTEQLELDGSNTKVTIGDGALFGSDQALQALVNSDDSFEYGSSQNKYGIISTTYGVFWVSQNQGKVFQHANGLAEISQTSMKWWFAKYLPSELLRLFPNYPLADNPVKGVGVQMMYDNTHEIVYITKRDYLPLNPDGLEYDEDGNFYIIIGYETTLSCPAGYTLQGNVCVRDTPCCPEGSQYIDGNCVTIETADPIPVGPTYSLTPTPYHEYGKYGTRVYSSPSISAPYTQLNPSNPFWNFNTSAPQGQSTQLNNGPVNRLAKWGLQLGTDSQPMNNYSPNWPDGSPGLPPVGQWIGFTTCLNIAQTKIYYIGVAADNRYRISVDGTVILLDDTIVSNPLYTAAFNYLHLYPITISAGNHTITVEGYNDGQLACFAVEIYDLTNLPVGYATPIDYLNAQTDYSNLDSRIIFTTRTANEFTSGSFQCPPGFTPSSSGDCNYPTCTREVIVPAGNCTLPPTETQVPIKQYCDLTNPECFKDISWTISYDPKAKAWISFHDWIPTFMIPGKQHFMTVNYDSIWKHNTRCDLYANYYGKNYPFEVEFISSTGQQVATTRSIEYLLEAYKFYNQCRDKFHILDENFDQAIIYNSEQISGLLELDLKSKINPVALLSYPQVGINSIRINYSKEENKYRFNQFWDITKDRGEYTGYNTPMFNVSPNGYVYDINPAYVDYNKPVLQRKKFRHHVGRVFLRRKVSGDVKLLFKISNQKLQPSYR